VKIASDGAAALEVARAMRPDVVLLDIGLPLMDGYEVARRFRAEGGRSTLVAVTGFGQAADRERTRAAGFDRHVVKPIDLAGLMRLVEEAPRLAV
jgi:CheY-like chemotaxis protein